MNSVILKTGWISIDVHNKNSPSCKSDLDNVFQRGWLPDEKECADNHGFLLPPLDHVVVPPNETRSFLPQKMSSSWGGEPYWWPDKNEHPHYIPSCLLPPKDSLK